MIYKVVAINGDYADLLRIDPPSETGETTLVALALLPKGTMEGSTLKRFMFEYELL